MDSKELKEAFEITRTAARMFEDASNAWQARAVKAEAEVERLRAAAERVCWFDWSSNDEDAVDAINALRDALRAITPSRAYEQSADRAEK